MQLRYSSTLTEIANDRSNTVIFPFPAELRGMLLGAQSGGGKG